MMKVKVTFKTDVLSYKTKTVKVYETSKEKYILYKGDKVPFEKLLLKKENEYFLNVLLYYSLEPEEYDEYLSR